MNEKKNELFEDPTSLLTYHYKKSPHEKLAGILGQPYIEYRKKWVEAGRYNNILDYPLHFNISLNDDCNLRCKTCVHSIPPEDRTYKSAQGIIPLDFFKKFIREAASRGLASIDFAINNEPLLVPNFVEYVKAAKDAGLIDIMLLTNATLLNEKVSEKLIESGLTWISFSLDAATPETYEIMRGANLSKTVANIEYFLKLKKNRNLELPITRVNFVKSKMNEKDLPAFKKYWEDKVDIVNEQGILNVMYASRDGNSIEKFDNELRNAVQRKKSVPECAYPYQRLSIRNNGDIIPCCSFFSSNFVIGNIYKDDIYELWNSDKMENIRASINAPEMDDKPECCRICFKQIYSWD